MSKVAPVTPIAIAVTFNDLPVFLADVPGEVSDGGLAVGRGGEDEGESEPVPTHVVEGT